LSKFFEELRVGGLSVVEGSNFIVYARVKLERDGIESHVYFQILVAQLNCGATQRAFLWVLEKETQNAESAEAVTA
jgi:hypothetical protein